MKKLFLWGMMAILGLLMTGCATTTTTTTIKTLGSGYIDFADQHIWVVSDQLEMPETEYYVYYYGDACSHCIDLKPTLLVIVAGLTEDTFYFVNVSTIHDVAEGTGVQRTPTLIRVVNGAVTEFYEGPSTITPILDTLS